MVKVYDHYFYPEFAAKGAIKQPAVENIKFAKLLDIQQSLEQAYEEEETKPEYQQYLDSEHISMGSSQNGDESVKSLKVGTPSGREITSVGQESSCGKRVKKSR